MHLKRQKVPKSWPIARKGSTYLVKPQSNADLGIPILIILRDMLKIAQNRKEVKRALHQKQILVNTLPAKDEKNCATLFDTITVIPSDKNYRLIILESGKFGLEEIGKNEAGSKIAKVANKKTLKNKKVQLNFADGKNLLSDVKCSVNDSVVLDLKNRKVEKCMPLKEKAEVFVFLGKYSGQKGIVEKMNEGGKTANVALADRKVDILIKQRMAGGK